jgi:hypothetical protein
MMKGGYNLLSQHQQAGGYTIFGIVERLAPRDLKDVGIKCSLILTGGT